MGREARKPFAILRPVKLGMPDIPDEWVLDREPYGEELAWFEKQMSIARAVAVDFETKGVRPWAAHPNGDRVVGMGVAWVDNGGNRHARYFAWDKLSRPTRCHLWRAMGNIPDDAPIVGHNVYFDSGWAWEQARRDEFLIPGERVTSAPIPWTHCTYGLYRAFASEGWFGQEWGLKAAMSDCLGWTETNEKDRDDWLIGHGYHKVGPKLEEGETPADHLRRCGAWMAENPKTRRGKVRPNLAEMWRVPTPILGRYCCLDALATLELHLNVMAPALERFPEFAEFHTGPWMRACLLLVEQTRFGVRVDLPKFLARIAWLENEVAEARAQIRTTPLKREIDRIEAERLSEILAEMRAKEPAKHSKNAQPKPPKKPLTKDGKPSAQQKKYERLMADIKRNGLPVAKAWLNWKARLEDAPNRFRPWSPGSVNDLRAAIYESGFIKTYPSDPAEDPKDETFILEGINGPVPMQKTDAGLYSIGAQAMSQFPKEWGGPLVRFTDADTELSIAKSYLDHLYFHPDDPSTPGWGWESVLADAETYGVQPHELAPRCKGTWRIHPGWKVPGTKTGRLGGKDPNWQAIPKSLEFLDPFVADEGCEWIEMDWSALEPHVLAELSRDDGLLDLYGPNANPNHDRYLYEVSKIPHPYFDVVRQYYDRSNPTPEGVAKAKKEGKPQREGGKVLVLSGDYGAGAKKKWTGLLLRGIKLTLQDVQEIHKAQQDGAPGVKRFKYALEDEWMRRGGWVLSGLGFPTPVHEEFKRDLINRVVQRTGHDCHTIFIWMVSSCLDAAGIWYKGIVFDYHDQLIFQVKKKDSAAALKVVRECVDYLNEYLGGAVKLKGEPQIVSNLAAAKMSEDYEKRAIEQALEAERELQAEDFGAAPNDAA